MDHYLDLTDTKLHYRKFERQLPRQVYQRDPVLIARPSPCCCCRMEGESQIKQTAFIGKQYYGKKISTENIPEKQSSGAHIHNLRLSRKVEGIWVLGQIMCPVRNSV